MSAAKKKVKIRWGRFLLSVFFLAAAALAGLLFWPLPEKPAEPEPVYAAPVFSDSEDVGSCPEMFDLLIRCVGDIMTHGPQIDAARNSDGSYDFSSNYEYVSHYFMEDDLTLANFETTFSGDGKYSGYPAFDAPEILATNVKDAGVDVAIFANNHMMDSRLAGARNTVEVLRANEFEAVVGARAETDEDRSAVIEVKGVKVGIVAYTYETPLVSGRRTMNGSYMDSAAPDYINSFRYYGGDPINSDDLDEIKEEMDWCRANGAEILIVYFHWGTEYKQSPDNSDRRLAEFAAENGADIIFASHPHVLQPIEYIEVPVEYNVPAEEPVEDPWAHVEHRPTTVETPAEEPEEDSWIVKLRKAFGLIEEPEPEEPVVHLPMPMEGPKAPVHKQASSGIKTVPVYYSMGNFVSNQRYETLSNTYGATKSRLTEQGMIANVEIFYNRQTGEIKYKDVSCIPTWVDKYNYGGATWYSVIPLDDTIDDNDTLDISGHRTRAKNALSSIISLLGEEFIYSGN